MKILIVALLGLAGCLVPHPKDGAVHCGKNDACPEGYRCAADGKCYNSSADLAPLADLALPEGDLSCTGTPSAECQAYCNCMGMSCASRFKDEGACLCSCASLTTDQYTCRNYHCGLATTVDPVLHCPHAVGIGLCQ